MALLSIRRDYDVFARLQLPHGNTGRFQMNTEAIRKSSLADRSHISLMDGTGQLSIHTPGGQR